MKFANTNVDIETSGDFQTGRFGFDMNAKMADMLSNKIYTDPIYAVAREYIANAVDAQGMNGALKKPVEIKLPNNLDPIWSVRDYGPGLSQADVMGEAPDYRGLFNTYGHSNKNDSNSAIGGFGLGSKAGFAYVKSGGAFNVISFHGGEKKTYTCHRDSDGMPTVSLMQTIQSDEPTGVRIDIPVISDDYQTFLENTRRTVKHMDCEFIFKGTTEVVKETPEYAFIMEGNNYKVCIPAKHAYGEEPEIVMGGISYPVQKRHFKEYVYRFLGTCPVIYAPIGTAELSVSREELSYEKSTIDSINDICQNIIDNIIAGVQAEINTKDNLLEASAYYHEVVGSRLGFINGAKSITYKGEKLLDSHVRLRVRRGRTYSPDYILTRKNIKDYRKPAREYADLSNSLSNLIEDNTLIIWARIKGPKAKFKQRMYQYMLDNELENLRIIVLTCATKFSFLRTLGKYARYVKHACLEDMPAYEGDYFSNASGTASTYIAKDKDDLTRDVSTFNCKTHAPASSQFDYLEVDFADTSKVYYYLPTKRYRLYPDFEDDTELPRRALTDLINMLDLHNKVVAIPFNYQCHVKNKPNWINLMDYLEDEFKDYSVPQVVMEYEYRVEVYSYDERYKDYGMSTLEKLGMLFKTTATKDDISKARQYIAYCRVIGKDGAIDPQSILNNIRKKVDKLLDKYPMLSILGRTVDKAELDKVKEYIAMIDKFKGDKND